MVTQHNCDTMPQLIHPAHPSGSFSIYCRPCLEIPFSYQDMLKYVQYILQRETRTHKEVMSLISSLKYVLYTLLQDIPCTIVQFVCLGGLPSWIGHTVNFTKARLELLAADLVIDRGRSGKIVPGSFCIGASGIACPLLLFALIVLCCWLLPMLLCSWFRLWRLLCHSKYKWNFVLSYFEMEWVYMCEKWYLSRVFGKLCVNIPACEKLKSKWSPQIKLAAKTITWSFNVLSQTADEGHRQN